MKKTDLIAAIAKHRQAGRDLPGITMHPADVATLQTELMGLSSTSAVYALEGDDRPCPKVIESPPGEQHVMTFMGVPIFQALDGRTVAGYPRFWAFEDL